MDIAEAFYNQYSLAWISHLGVTPPIPTVTSGINWLNGFGGGLLTTCGLTHVGGPEKDEYGERGLHDRISHIPATLESIIQPDLYREKHEISITGRMLQSTVFGSHLELKRTITAELGSSKIKIKDEVTNLGNEPAPHMMLYHFNFGWPLVDEGTKILWEGQWKSRGSNLDNFIYDAGNDFKTCKAPIDEHNGNGESVAFIDIDSDSSGICECAIYNPNIPLRVKLRFKKEQLPWLTNWQHWGKNEYVTALEPGTHPPIGQSTARNNNTLLFIQPGDTMIYEIEMEVNPN
jgi:galactose mutarotase-like enzyme